MYHRIKKRGGLDMRRLAAGETKLSLRLIVSTSGASRAPGAETALNTASTPRSPIPFPDRSSLASRRHVPDPASSLCAAAFPPSSRSELDPRWRALRAGSPPAARAPAGGEGARERPQSDRGHRVAAQVQLLEGPPRAGGTAAAAEGADEGPGAPVPEAAPAQAEHAQARACAAREVRAQALPAVGPQLPPPDLLDPAEAEQVDLEGPRAPLLPPVEAARPSPRSTTAATAAAAAAAAAAASRGLSHIGGCCWRWPQRARVVVASGGLGRVLMGSGGRRRREGGSRRRPGDPEAVNPLMLVPVFPSRRQGRKSRRPFAVAPAAPLSDPSDPQRRRELPAAVGDVAVGVVAAAAAAAASPRPRSLVVDGVGVRRRLPLEPQQEVLVRLQGRLFDLRRGRVDTRDDARPPHYS